MMPAATNIRIAEWLGWTFIPEYSAKGLFAKAHWRSIDGRCSDNPPSYTTSLNACAEFERELDKRGGMDVLNYYDAIGDIQRPNEYFGKTEHMSAAPWCFIRMGATATAAQRCEALIRVINDERFRREALPEDLGESEEVP